MVEPGICYASSIGQVCFLCFLAEADFGVEALMTLHDIRGNSAGIA